MSARKRLQLQSIPRAQRLQPHFHFGRRYALFEFNKKSAEALEVQRLGRYRRHEYVYTQNRRPRQGCQHPRNGALHLDGCLFRWRCRVVLLDGVQPDVLAQHGVGRNIGTEVLLRRLMGENNALGIVESRRRIARRQRQGEHSQESRIHSEEGLVKVRIAIRYLAVSAIMETDSRMPGTLVPTSSRRL